MVKTAVATYLLDGGNFKKEIIEKVGARLILSPCQSEDDIAALAGQADAIITVLTFQPFPRETIEKLKKVRHIASMGVGFENIDLAAASEKAIVVTNTPFYCTDEVSDHVIALLTSLSRKLFQADKAARTLRWRGSDSGFIQEVLRPLRRIRGRTLGLIGFGAIARTLAPKAKGLGLNIIACDPFVPKEIMKLQFGVEKVELKELLKTADFISLHVNLTAQNQKMLGEKHFKLMKPTAYFINTARGGLVDQEALAKALTEKWIAGAGLDVLDPEPPHPDNPLLKMENVIVSGHFAQYSDDSEAELWRTPLEEIALTLRGKFPRFPVNSEVKEKWLKRWRR